MAKINSKAFTLVELLAVIVILAIILVIAVPSIISTITESRKGALSSSAKLIASSAESMKISNQALGIEKDITCQDVSSYTEEDYTCNLEFVDGKAKVTLVGKGKFEGMSVCTGTKEDAEVTEGTCGGTGGNESGGGSESGGSTTTPTLISFTMDGISYQAEEGMTWIDWVKTSYNTGGIIVEGEMIYNSNYTRMYDTTLSSSIIRADESYTSSRGLGPISTFTIGGTSYDFRKGMTWAEWVESDYNDRTWGIDDRSCIQSISNMMFSGRWVIKNLNDSNSKVSSEDSIIPEYDYGTTYQGGIAN